MLNMMKNDVEYIAVDVTIFLKMSDRSLLDKFLDNIITHIHNKKILHL